MVNPVFSSTLPAELAVVLSTIMPELLLGVSAIILLIGGVFAGERSVHKLQALAVFVLISMMVLMHQSPLADAGRHVIFSQLFVIDDFGRFIKYLLGTGSVLVFLLSFSWLAAPEHMRPEFTVLSLMALLGMFMMVSANDFMALYMGMELSSLALYVLATFDRDSLKSTESGIKYFVLGALASGLYLFGASLVYGFSGSTGYEAVALVTHNQHAISPGLLTGLVLIVTAFCFKVSAAPFHMWTPDVYEGAPTPVTAYFSIAPKIAAMAVLCRLLQQPFQDMSSQWQQVIVVASIASMLVGAFGALWQTNVKRLLAYSSIGHVGYALVGVATGSISGITGVLVYLALYLFASAGAFACIMVMKRNGKPVEGISELAGLSRRQPYIAFAFALFMFSMAGIPPLAGFFGKMYVFLAALKNGLLGLAIIGVLSSVVACFYYLKVVKVMYFDEPADSFDQDISLTTKTVLLISALVTFFFFLVPAPLVEAARSAAEALFH